MENSSPTLIRWRLTGAISIKMKILKWIIAISLLPLALVGAHYRHQGQQLAASGQCRVWGLGEWNNNTEVYLRGDVLAVVKMRYDWDDPAMPRFEKPIRDAVVEPINPRMQHARAFTNNSSTAFNHAGVFVDRKEFPQPRVFGTSPPPGSRLRISIVEVNTRYAYLFGLPLLVLVTLSIVRRYRRPSHDQCHVCGYDLRASPERCPECGTERKEDRKANTA